MSAQVPGPIDGASTRERILRAAFQLFHEQGYHATGIATILREAGVNPGSMYHAFPGKEALLHGVLEYALRLLGPAVMTPAEARSDDPLERVFELLTQYREGLAHAGCKMGCPIGNLALEVGDDHPAARELIHANFENWTSAVERWFTAAGDRLPRELDRRRLARFVLTTMEGGLMLARAAGNLAPFDDAVAELRAYIAQLEARARSAAKPATPRSSKKKTSEGSRKKGRAQRGASS